MWDSVKRERIGTERWAGKMGGWREEKKTTTTRKTHAVVEGGVERMSVLCCNMCEYVLLSVLFIQHHWFRKCFLTKNPLLKIYSKILQKTSEVFFSLLSLSLSRSISFSFFSSLFPEYGDQCCCSGFHLKLNVSKMNNHYFDRSYSKALQLQKTWYDIQHLLHLYNVIQQCIESSDLNL